MYCIARDSTDRFCINNSTNTENTCHMCDMHLSRLAVCMRSRKRFLCSVNFPTPCSKLCQIQHMCSEDLYKPGREYLNALSCKFHTFSRQNSDTFDRSHIFLSLTVAKVSTLKNSLVFGPPCRCSKQCAVPKRQLRFLFPLSE